MTTSRVTSSFSFKPPSSAVSEETASPETAAALFSVFPQPDRAAPAVSIAARTKASVRFFIIIFLLVFVYSHNLLVMLQIYAFYFSQTFGHYL